MSGTVTPVNPLISVGTWKQNTAVKARLTGTLNNYTQLAVGNCEVASTPRYGRYIFNGNELSLEISLADSLVAQAVQYGMSGVIKEVRFYKIKLFFGSTLIKTIDCYQPPANAYASRLDYFSIKAQNKSVQWDISVPFNATKRHESPNAVNGYGNHAYIGHTEVESESEKTLYENGYHRLYVEFEYSDEYTQNGMSSQTWIKKTVTFELGSVYIYPLTLKSITLNHAKAQKTFYKNGTYDKTGVVVYSHWFYDDLFGGNEGGTYDVTSSSTFSSPAMNSVGTKTVTATYSGKTASYDILVIGASSASNENTNSKFRYLVDTNPGLPTSVQINYTNNTSVTITPTTSNFQWTSGDLNSTGTKTWNYKVLDPNTGEWTAGTSTKYVRDVTKLAVKTEPTKKQYQTNETFNTNGLVVTATYSDAGTFDIGKNTSPLNLGNVNIANPDMSVVGAQRVDITYRNKTTSFNINIDGLTSIRLYHANLIDGAFKILKGDTSTVVTNGLQIFATTSDNGEEEIPLAGKTGFDVAIDTSAVNRGVNGVYPVVVSVTHEGNTISETFNVVVYSLESLSVSGYKNEFIYTGSAPTFSTGALVVTAEFSDGSTRVLSANEYSVSEPDNMNMGSHVVTVSSTIGTTVSTTYTIQVVEDYPETITSVDLTNWNGVFVEGDTFSKAGIVVKATMHSGITNKEVDFTTSLDGKVFGTDIESDLTFSIFVETNDHSNPLEVVYNSSVITSNKQLQVKYDVLTGISVNAGNQTSALRWMRAGDQFTDYIADNNKIVVTATYAYSGNKILPRTAYTLSKQVGEVWTKDDMGDNTITVSFGGMSDTYVVRVSILFAIEVESERTPNLYNRYEQLDTSELTITRKYTHDGENAELGGSVISIDNVRLTGSYRQLVPDNQDGLTTTIGFSYTEAGVTVSTSMNVTVKALTSVALSSNKFSINYGELFSLVGESVTITFNTGDIYNLTINSGNRVTIDGVNYDLSLSLDSLTIKGKVENVTLGMSFGQETKYAAFTIHCVYLDHISLDASYYTNQTLYAGDTIALNNLIVKKYIYSTDDEDENYPEETTLDNDDVVFSISDGQILVAGNNALQVIYAMGVGNTYQSKSTSITFVANQIALQSISVDTTDLEKALNSYVEGQSLSLVGLVVNAVFNRSLSNRALAITECKVYFDDTEKYYTSAVSTDDDGKDLIIAYTYDGVTKTATVGELSVAAKILVSIAIRESSTHKVNYLIGDKFTTAGLILEATYNDGYEEIVSSGFTTDYDAYKTNEFEGANAGTNTVTVSLTVGEVTETCTYDITVGNPSLVDLRFDTSLISTSVTNGSSYSLSGLVVYGIFENGHEEELTFTAPNIATELSYDSNNKIDFDSNNLGVKPVTISCQNPYDNLQIAVTKSLMVTVTPNMELVDIRLKFDSEQDPYNYRVGDTFNGKGLTVEALFKDTDWMSVTGWETSNPTLGSLLRSGGRLTVKVSYTSQGIVKSQEYTIVVAMPYDSGIVEENTYKMAFNVASVTREEATLEFNENTMLPLFHANLISVDNNEESPTYGLNVYIGSNANNDCVGYVKLGATSEIDGSVIENGQVILFEDPVNPIDGDGNIVVRFPHYVAGYADRINKCHFGVIYNNRLFVSGNPDHPNVDWHSSQVNSSQVENYDTEEDKDLTYFSDLDYCKYGSENSAVKGYDIYRDGTLLVFKGKAQHEATIYTRQKQLVNASSFDGTVVSEGELAEEAYPCFPVNPNGGAGAISNYSIINFVGETLVLTRNGIKAVTSKESTYNNAKYTYDVSSHINNKLLKNNDLNYVSIFQFDEKLLVRTDEGIYVGEFSLRDDNSEYEWYFCNNINAYYFFELDNELYFSDRFGNINRFIDTKDITRKDKPRTYVGLGGATLQIDSNNDVIIISKDYADQVVEGREFHLLSKISAITGNVTDESQVYAKMGNFINKNVRENAIANNIPSFDITAWEGMIDAEANQIIIKPYTSAGDIDYERMNDTLLLFPTYKVVYIDQIVGNVVSVQVDRPYQIKRIKSSTSFDYRFILLDFDNNEIDLTGIESMRMSFRVNNVQVAYITDVQDYGTDGGKQFKVGLPVKKDEYLILDLINYYGRNGTYQGVITDHVNVESYFVTKPFNLNHDLYQKSIYMWSIINDSQIASAMSVGYIASRKYADFKIAVKEIGGARQLSFENFNFEKIHFSNDKLPHIYNRYRTLSNVGFIRFIFKNDEGTRMVLSKLDIIYSYSLLMKGVK